MIKASVFISHSTRDDPLARAMLTAIPEALGDGYRSWVDKREMQVAEEWRPQIYRNIMGANAVVLLLSPAAAESDWVTIEAVFAAGRRSIDASFKFIVVRFPGVSTVLTKGLIGHLDLNAVQALKVDANAVAADAPAAVVAAEAARVAKQVRGVLDAAFPSAGPSSPYDMLLDAVVRCLGDGGLTQNELDKAARDCGVDISLDATPERARAGFAEKLLDQAAVTQMELVRKLFDQRSKSYARELLHLVGSQWAPPGLAAQFLNLAGMPEGKRAALLDNVHPLTAHAYICRSCCSALNSQRWWHLEYELPATEDVADQIHDQVLGRSDAELRRLLDHQPHRKAAIQRERVQAWKNLRAEAADRPPFFIVAEPIEPTALDQVRKDFQMLTFVFLRDAAASAVGLPLLRTIDSDTEDAAVTAYRTLEATIEAALT